MFTGLAFLESPAVTTAANAGISLLMALNVQLPYRLMVLCTWRDQGVKIFTASTILRATVTTSTKARCAWDSGLVIVLAMEMLTPTRAGIQCPGSLLKKFQNPRPRSRDKTFIPTEKRNLKWDVDKLLNHIKWAPCDCWLYCVMVYVFFF